MITLSGKWVFPDTYEPALRQVPSVMDIAVGLGRIPRFAGQTRRWWPVLLHSFVAERLGWYHGESPRMRFLLLNHDAHESVTGDVPTTWKPPSMKEDQRTLDDRFYSFWHIDPPTDSERKTIRHFDLLALACEAALVGPRQWQPVVVTLPLATADACGLVQGVMQLYPNPLYTDGPTSVAVQDFIKLFNDLGTRTFLGRRA